MKKAPKGAFVFAPECVREVYAQKSVMLCGRGLRTTHIHRPHTTCFQLQKYNLFPIPQALRRKKLDFPEKFPIFVPAKKFLYFIHFKINPNHGQEFTSDCKGAHDCLD